MQVIISLIWNYVYWYLRPVFKWFLHKTTRLSELQRICYGAVGTQRTKGVEISLAQSRTPSIKALVQHLYKLSDEGKFHGKEADHLVEYAVAGVTQVKKIDTTLHFQFVNSFGNCMDQILGYRQLVYEVEKVRNIPFCSENAAHELKLLELWMLLMPDKPLEARITKQWGEIGFQGDDPKTDFRGMGMLGLDNLTYFATEYNGAARHVLSHSHHPKYGYSFAIVGINLTSLAYSLLIHGNLKTHLYNVTKSRANLEHFHQVYAYLFYEFDKFWLAEKPKDIMEFNRIRDKFTALIKDMLDIPATIFRINLAVDTV